jgi:signal transduction histidine kinase
MDSFLAPLIAQESARPYFHYTPFYPAERAYTRMFAKIEPDEVLIPSPLLTFESPYIHLHFQIDSSQNYASPQTPEGNMRDLAEVADYRCGERIRASKKRLKQLSGMAPVAELCRLLPNLPAQSVSVLEPQGNDAVPLTNPRVSPASQQQLNKQEQVSRYQMAMNNVNVNFKAQTLAKAPTPVTDSLLRPIWIKGELLLARRVKAGGEDYIQGCWLNWHSVRARMLDNIRDLLPNAQVVAEAQAGEADDTRRLASLPVYLIPGTAPLGVTDASSPVARSLALAWAAALVASLLAAIVLWQTISLSERRGAFVSAVTHELRTPLTTFRLYTELLTKNPDAPADKRTGYLSTLRREADRLSHLVENVLAYARLERKSVSARMEEHAVGDLVERSRERLGDRAAQAELRMEVEVDPNAADAKVRVDPGNFEQVLFNLVDNAAKYAAGGTEPTLRLEATRDDTGLLIRVRDRGPGISPQEARRLFRPFSKSARQAAVSAPGVGLGLALSRRLARQMGGDLRLEPGDGKGACFVFELPVV